MDLYKFYTKIDASVVVARMIFNYLESHAPLKKIQDIAETTSGGTPSRNITSYYGGNIPWIKSGELNDGFIEKSEEYITEEGLNNSSAKVYPKGTLVLALYGATVGKVGILNIEAASNQAVCAIFPNKDVNRDYLFWFFRQKRYDYIKSSFGGAQPNISQKVVKGTLAPIPDYKVQENIVKFLNHYESKRIISDGLIDEFLVDEVKRFHMISNTHQQVTNEILQQENWIKTLRKLILQEAVQGKLVEQDPNDEPAAVLLERIREEKERLIKEKKIKKEKPLPPITPDEIPYELPKGWEWVRLGEIVYSEGGKTPSKANKEYWDKGDILWVSPKDMKTPYIIDSEDKITSIALQETSIPLVPVGSLLIVVRSGILKRTIPLAIVSLLHNFVLKPAS
jgi:type I restriction enzyme S subunit